MSDSGLPVRKSRKLRHGSVQRHCGKELAWTNAEPHEQVWAELCTGRVLLKLHEVDMFYIIT